MEESQCPLVTFALFAYNQEQYIRDAVEAALAQDYPKLEIILSDDSSTDRTFAIMEELATHYAGPHRIKLNRNEANLGRIGIGSHVNKVVEISRGELFVFAAGDDVSAANRVSKLTEAWMEQGCPHGSIHSATIAIDESGQEVGIGGAPTDVTGWQIVDVVRAGGRILLGASHCVTRSVLDQFGPLPADALFEDRTLALRSQLVGQIIYVPDPLVRYRVHGGGISNPDLYHSRARLERWLYGIEVVQRTLRTDLALIERILPPHVTVALDREEKWLARSRWMLSSSLLIRMCGAWCYARERSPSDRLAFVLAITASGSIMERIGKSIYRMILRARQLSRSVGV